MLEAGLVGKFFLRGILKKNMEATIVHLGYIGIIWGLGFVDLGFRDPSTLDPNPEP